MSGKEPLFNEMELDAIKEVMNISFGSASADLAELMDIFVQLNIPKVTLFRGDSLLDHLSEEIIDFDTCSIIQQEFYGDFEGKVFLVFAYGMEKELLSYFRAPEILSFQSDELMELEKEVLLEIGSLLIGACVGKLYDFLKADISYLRPQCVLGRKFRELNEPKDKRNRESFISLKTYFSFEDRSVAGHLFMISGEESALSLKNALSLFQEPLP
ncbi:MAG: chemotaxis protein CheC [Spirochaetales bacterium]|nr:chemotaxis protein CheC [Spirochaetales bacterium]